MQAFAALLDRLVLTPQRSMKLRLVSDYLRAAPDPERGYALAALTGELDLPAARPGLIRALAAARADPDLFALSYDYVGDLAETVALIWPQRFGVNRVPSLTEVVEGLSDGPRAQAGERLARWLDGLDATGRWALLKLVTGGLRIGVSARLAKQAAADLAGVEVSAVEEIWHGQSPPYLALFAWLDGRAPRPEARDGAGFRPVMLAQPLAEADLSTLRPDAFGAEWKWDGVRVQAVSAGSQRRLYTRAGEDITAAFPDVAAALGPDAVIDGELLVLRDGRAAAFADLQQRLNRKTVDAKLMERCPGHIRAYDLLAEAGADLRALAFRERRGRLAADLAAASPPRIDLSPLVAFADWDELQRLRSAPPDPAVEGVMLKRWDSVYEAGRPKGLWFKWKRDPFLADCVLMYAQRGHGKRSSFYSDFTFGAWRDGPAGLELAPVGKAYSGFTDDELKALDRFVREHTVERFGPVRAVRANADFGLVLEIAFEGLARSARHKSGVAMRFPRIHRIRWDKPAGEADHLTVLERLLDP
jgi:DNA ligase-1